jgi:hypothetical protein
MCHTNIMPVKWRGNRQIYKTVLLNVGGLCYVYMIQTVITQISHSHGSPHPFLHNTFPINRISGLKRHDHHMYQWKSDDQTETWKSPGRMMGLSARPVKESLIFHKSAWDNSFYILLYTSCHHPYYSKCNRKKHINSYYKCEGKNEVDISISCTVSEWKLWIEIWSMF